MMTLPTTAKGTAVVSVGKGVKINHLHYWSPVFRDPAVERTSVPVRYDPYDAGTAPHAWERSTGRSRRPVPR
jgi:putative transposase